MSKQKLTPWFPMSIRPVRHGVYQILTTDGESHWYSYYRDSFSHGLWFTPDRAVEFSKDRYSAEGRFKSWRGIAK